MLGFYVIGGLIVLVILGLVIWALVGCVRLLLFTLKNGPKYSNDKNDFNNIGGVINNESIGRESRQGYKPVSIYTFFGQHDIIQDLIINLETIKPGYSLEHTLLCGNPGLGKTLLANVLANDLGGEFIFTTGPNLTKKQDIERILFKLRLKDVWFIDEIHSLKKEELLYSPMQDFHYEGRPLERFTLIGATTTAGTLKKPLLDRFIHQYEFQLYTAKELTLMLYCLENIRFNEKIGEYVAKRSKGIPRLALNFAQKIIKQSLYDKSSLEESCVKVFKRLGIDELGLNPTDIKILKFLANHGAVSMEKAIGEEVLAMVLNLDQKDLVFIHEPWLLHIGFIMRTPKGRIITKKGLAYLEEHKMFGAI